MWTGTACRTNEIVLFLSLVASLVVSQRSCLKQTWACAQLPESHAVSLGEKPCRVRHPKLNCPSGIYSPLLIIWCVCMSFLRRAWYWIFCCKILNYRDFDGRHLPTRAEGRLLIRSVSVVSLEIAIESGLPIIISLTQGRANRAKSPQQVDVSKAFPSPEKSCCVGEGWAFWSFCGCFLPCCSHLSIWGVACC